MTDITPALAAKAVLRWQAAREEAWASLTAVTARPAGSFGERLAAAEAAKAQIRAIETRLGYALAAVRACQTRGLV